MTEGAPQSTGSSVAQKLIIFVAIILVAYLVSRQAGCPMVEQSETLEWEHNDR